MICDSCHGSGFYRAKRDTYMVSSICLACKGSGITSCCEGAGQEADAGVETEVGHLHCPRWTFNRASS